MQFGFDPDDPDGPHRIENHAEHRVVYASTHDSDTVRGWLETAAAGASTLDDVGVHRR